MCWLLTRNDSDCAHIRRIGPDDDTEINIIEYIIYENIFEVKIHLIEGSTTRFKTLGKDFKGRVHNNIW